MIAAFSSAAIVSPFVARMSWSGTLHLRPRTPRGGVAAPGKLIKTVGHAQGWQGPSEALRRRRLGSGFSRFGLARNRRHGGCEQRLEFAPHKRAESTPEWPAYAHTLGQSRPALARLEQVVAGHLP